MANRKLLILCDESPFPVRDGISAAISSFVLRVEKKYDIYYFINKSFFFLKDSNSPELKHVKCFFDEFDVYVTSPILPSIKNSFKLPRSATKIALLSDCYTHVLWMNIKLAMRFGYASITSLKELLKIPIYYMIELIISKKYNYILLQTPRDKSIFQGLFLSKNVIDLPNITINEEDIDNRALSKRNGIGWVATFESSYLSIAQVFFENVLVKVLSNNAECKISFLGKGSKVFVHKLWEKYPFLKEQLIAEPFCPEIKGFYLKKKIIICPVFKNYGLINKTIESLTHGCITIGDKGAFNGIQGFTSGVHGFVAEKFEDFIRIIEEKNKFTDENLSLNAISLIKNFNQDKLYPEEFKRIFKL